MSQPPYPPQGGNESGGDQPGQPGWKPPGTPDQPTEQVGPPSGPPGGAGQRDQTQQFGRPGYGQPPYGQPPYGQPPYGQQPGQPGYGQPYGQQPYGPYGQQGPPWAPPGGQQPKGNKSTLIALAVAGVVLAAAVGIALWLLLGDSDGSTTAAGSSSSEPSEAATSTSERSSSSSSQSSSSSSPSSSTEAEPSGEIPPPTVSPEGLGDDPVMNSYAQDCYDGDMEACDTLFLESEVDSEYELYGGTCAGRQPISDASTIYCTVAFPSE